MRCDKELLKSFMVLIIFNISSKYAYMRHFVYNEPFGFGCFPADHSFLCRLSEPRKSFENIIFEVKLCD